MPSYLAKVQRRMDIYTKRRTRSILSGNYGSVFKGRSMDFDDLREYVPGDDIKDIDWKASARSKSVMIRRYIAIRKRNILIVADSGRNMATLAPSGETKSELALFCAGAMAYIALSHSDIVGMVYGNQDENKRFPLKESRSNAENFLNNYAKSLKLEAGASNINSTLQYAVKCNRERLMIVLITDPTNAANTDLNLIRRLNARHEIMFIMAEDAPLTAKNFRGKDTKEIDGMLRLPSFMRSNRSVARAEENYRQNLYENIRRNLRHYGVTCCFVDGTENAVYQIMQMLEEQKHAKRR